MVLGGSFWRPYLLGVVPSVVLCAALVAGAPAVRGRVMRVSVLLAAVSCVVSMIGWVASNSSGVEPPTEIYTGQAIRDVSEPGDTIVVYGGRADIVMASGLESPYEHLWSLPMRTLDPHLDGLSALLASDRRPTWFVEWVSFSDWEDFGNADFQAVLKENYDLHGDGCGHHIWLRDDVERADAGSSGVRSARRNRCRLVPNGRDFGHSHAVRDQSVRPRAPAGPGPLTTQNRRLPRDTSRGKRRFH